MRFHHSIWAAIAATSLLSACTSYRGANRLHDASDLRSVRAADYYGVQQMFIDDLKRLVDKRKLGNRPDQAAMEPLLNSGFSLIRLYCNEYFNEMGRNQRNSAILRDLIKPLTDAVNLVIGLKLLSDAENVNADLVTGFAGFSSTAAAGLSIYDRHFLFDNDNIAAVRTMTMNVLAENRAAVYKNPPDDVVLAIGQLQENENLCTPSQILSNVRETIKKGVFETKTTGGNQTSDPAPAETVEPEVPASKGTVPSGSESQTTTPA
ncbi:MAG TPA: hypothetical protein VMN38_05630 [Sphingomicrobium sp.]|nr:hypothetical protein [Sphingomicrobium sp.]